MERSSRVLQHWNPKSWFFFKKVRNWRNWILSVTRVSVPEKRNRPGFVNVSPTLVIDTSMERSSRALQLGNTKFWFFFSKKFEIELWLVFWLVPKSWNHLNFVNISPTLVIDTYQWKGLHKLYNMETHFVLKKNSNWIWRVPKSWNSSSRSQHEPIWRHRGCIVVPSRIDI